jgi:DNA-binding NarL/FixJ family response regulator
MLVARVLIVDDFTPFRRYLWSMLDQEPGLRLVGEASDGIEALQKVGDLQPDLVLLDVGLPQLNGIDAGRQIRKLAPRAKILFLSQEFSFDLVQEAFRLGASGYVHKQRAADELLPAIKAVLSDMLFVSSGLNDSVGSAGTHTHRHEVAYCSDLSVLLDSLTDFIATNHSAGAKTLVLATKPHLEDIYRRLNAQGLSVDVAVERGSLVPLDVADALPQFMVNEMPDSARFLKALCPVIDRVMNETGSHSRIVVCGECASTLMAQGNVDGAIRLEQLWDQFARAFKLDTLCVYASEPFDRAHDYRALQSISAEHSAICSR